MNPTLVLQQIRKTLDDAPDAAALSRVRATLDEPAFFSALNEYLRGLNDADTKSAILSDIIAISRQCGDRTAKRKNDLTNVRYGIGIGGAIATGSVIGLATVGTAILLLPFFAGCWIAGLSISKTGTLSEEEQIYTDIAGRASRIREKFDAT
jgi:hypothetical protein